MGWKENRRRKRTWYRHYRTLCDKVLGLADKAQRNKTPISGEAIVQLFYSLYEKNKLHKRRRIAISAWDSLRLAVEDTGLSQLGLVPRLYDKGKRPPSVDALEPLTAGRDEGDAGLLQQEASASG